MGGTTSARTAASSAGVQCGSWNSAVAGIHAAAARRCMNSVVRVHRAPVSRPRRQATHVMACATRAVWRTTSSCAATSTRTSPGARLPSSSAMRPRYACSSVEAAHTLKEPARTASSRERPPARLGAPGHSASPGNTSPCGTLAKSVASGCSVGGVMARLGTGARHRGHTGERATHCCRQAAWKMWRQLRLATCEPCATSSWQMLQGPAASSSGCSGTRRPSILFPSALNRRIGWYCCCCCRCRLRTPATKPATAMRASMLMAASQGMSTMAVSGFRRCVSVTMVTWYMPE